ncbi:MAG: metallophosphoesterase [Sulfolobales archaeon]
MNLIKIYKDLHIVSGYPYLYLEKSRSLILADIHLGYEEAVAQEGIFLPRAQLLHLRLELNSVLKELDTESIIIVGDLKHRFDKLSKQEREEIEALVNFLKEKNIKNIKLIRGNHDNYISLITRKLGVELFDSLVVDNILLVHGHVDPFETGTEEYQKNIDLVIYGHEHPSIVLRDSLGRVGKLPIFLEMPLKLRDRGIKAIILPATGYYQLGSSITFDPNKYLSPITQRYGLIEEAKPYAILREESIFEMPPLKLIIEYIDLGPSL